MGRRNQKPSVRRSPAALRFSFCAGFTGKSVPYHLYGEIVGHSTGSAKTTRNLALVRCLVLAILISSLRVVMGSTTVPYGFVCWICKFPLNAQSAPQQLHLPTHDVISDVLGLASGQQAGPNQACVGRAKPSLFGWLVAGFWPGFPGG